MNSPPRFPPMLLKGNNFCGFLFTSLMTQPFQNWDLSEEVPVTSCSLKEGPNEIGDKFWLVRITSPGSIPIHLKQLLPKYHV